MSPAVVATAIGLLVLVALLVVLRLRFVAVRVEGTSMLPGLQPGERVLVRRTSAGRIRRGQVVVLRFPPIATAPVDHPPWLIKRAAAVPGDPVPPSIPVTDSHVPPGCLVLLSDNTTGTFDSRRAGYFDADTLLGVVVRTMRA